MSSLRLAKLAQLMKEAKEQYFNLYNNMDDPIYVNQKGRTISDVEVLPGKTLSGCITSSDLTVYYRNLMKGKDSKVISSNELIALLPSLTTKKGELSPTLNVSKVLINVVIEKYNSANKLAGMRKVAEDGQSYDDTEYPEVTAAETKESYIARAKGLGSSQSDAQLGANYDRSVASYSAQNSGSSNSTTKKIQTTRKAPARAYSDVIKRDLWKKTVKDNAGYTFVIGADGKSLTYSKNNSPAKTLNQSYGNWPQLVKNIDGLTPVAGSDSAAATTGATDAARPAEAATPAKTEEAKPAATDFSAKETVLGQVLQKMYDNKLVGTPGIDFVKESRRAKIIMDGAGSGPGTGKSAAYAVAKLILNENAGLEASIPSSYAEAISSKQFLTPLQEAINAFYDNAFKWSRTAAGPEHAGFWKRLGGRTLDDKAATTILAGYIRSGLGARITRSSSHVDPKIKKLATLRRLRVRSQMEAATESSTRFGRSRIS